MDIVSNLKDTQTKTLPCFELNEEQLARCYAQGKWNIRFILHHIADAETVFHDRLKRVAEPRQVIWAFDQDAWAEHLAYDHYPLELSKANYTTTRNSIVHLAEKFYEKHGQREFVHSETGVRTLKDEFDKVVWHNQHHLEQ